MTHSRKIKKQTFFLLEMQKFPPDKRHPGHRSRYGKYGPRTACQPIRIENFEKPYNKTVYPGTSDQNIVRVCCGTTNTAQRYFHDGFPTFLFYTNDGGKPTFISFLYVFNIPRVITVRYFTNN